MGWDNCTKNGRCRRNAICRVCTREASFVVVGWGSESAEGKSSMEKVAGVYCDSETTQ